MPAVQVVDVAFPIRGKTLPLDHGYPLFSSLSKVVATIHESNSWGIHPVQGFHSGPGVLDINDKSTLKIRIPATEISAILPLTGVTLEVQGHEISLGAPRIFPLVPSPRLNGRYCTVAGFEEQEPFVKVLRQLLARIPNLGQDPARIVLKVTHRRVMDIAGYTVVGFAVTLEKLIPSASLAVQIHGLGGRRHLGGGIFVPSGGSRA